MSPIRLIGRTFYNKWIENVTCCEPKFDELPEYYLLQLDDCMRAAVRKPAAQEGLRPLISSFLGAPAEEGEPPHVPNEETIGAIDAS